MIKQKITTTTMEQPKIPDSDGKDQNTSRGRGGRRGRCRGQNGSQGQCSDQKRNTTRYDTTATKFQGKSSENKFVSVTLTANEQGKQAKKICDMSQAYAIKNDPTLSQMIEE